MVSTVKEHRERLGLTQAQLAHEAGVTEKTVRDIEKGSAVPRLDTARRLARSLGVSVDDLTPEATTA